MKTPKFLASIVAVATASTLAVAPAQALETSIKDSTCTVELNSSEKATWDKAIKQPNDVNLGIMPFKVKPAKAEQTRKDFRDQLDDLELQKESAKARLNIGTLDEEMTKKDKGTVAVVDVIMDLSKKYENALSACAKNKTYDSKLDKSLEKKKKDDKDANTSSNMNEETKTTLYSLLGVAGFFAVAWFAQQLLPALPKLGINIPGIPA